MNQSKGQHKKAFGSPAASHTSSIVDISEKRNKSASLIFPSFSSGKQILLTLSAASQLLMIDFIKLGHFFSLKVFKKSQKPICSWHILNWKHNLSKISFKTYIYYEAWKPISVSKLPLRSSLYKWKKGRIILFKMFLFVEWWAMEKSWLLP